MESARLQSYDDMRTFVLGGNAYFTLANINTGNRYTFRSRLVKDGDPAVGPFFISVLTGPDNTSDYQYLGTVFVESAGIMYRHGHKSRISDQAPSNHAIKWFINFALDRKPDTKAFQFWHEGRCGVCGRKLTVPSSVASGIGPKCAAGGF